MGTKSNAEPQFERLKLIIAYDGAGFAGWQSQSHRNTVQDHLERAFARITGHRVSVQGAGRTDAGVHALAQCAHADVASRKLTPPRWLSALNGSLPPTIRVLRCQRVSKSFHARFSAKGKIYRYRIWAAPVLPPLEYERAWHVTAPLDFALMNSAVKPFVGTQDFVGFSANRGRRAEDTIRTIHSITMRKRGPCVTLDFDGNGFLYKMVRLIIGTLVQCASGQRDLAEISQQLAGRHPDPSRFVAPAGGLFLVRVRY
jgi:tRNA pseudouridine38-40 synthase